MTTKRVALMVSIVLCGAGLVMGQTVWEQYPGCPLVVPGNPGDWDEGGRAVLAVATHDGTYHMWFAGMTVEGDPTDIGHATSPDGIAWTMDLANPVLTRGAPGEWDENYIWGVAVIHDGTQFRMWYEGEDGVGISRGGYATSLDGSAWTKHAGNPVMDAGPPASYDARGVGPKTVIVDGDSYRMWYTGYGEAPFAGPRIFTAESADGITWTKHELPVLDRPISGWDSVWIANPAVVFDGSIYHMWYTGADDWPPSNKSIGYAWSPDGIAWTKFDGNPVVEPITEYQYTCAVVFDGSTFHMWYNYWTGGLNDYVCYATSQDGNLKRFIPAAAFASGAEGSFFQTDVDVSNAGGQSATYNFTWLPRGEDNSDPITSDNFSLGAGMSVRYANVLDAVFDLEPDALGALSITASSPDLLAMSRTYNTPSAKSGGTFGQSMPAIPVSQFNHSGERRRILFGTEHTDMRTNVGCQNGVDHTITVNLELFDAAGTPLETKTMVLPPLGNKQINRIFEEYAPVTGAVDVWTDDADSSFYCYGSVLDNVTSDPTTIPPQ